MDGNITAKNGRQRMVIRKVISLAIAFFLLAGLFPGGVGGAIAIAPYGGGGGSGGGSGGGGANVGGAGNRPGEVSGEGGDANVGGDGNRPGEVSGDAGDANVGGAGNRPGEDGNSEFNGGGRSVSAAVYVHFVSYGTDVPPLTLEAGDKVPKPSVIPVRLNYSFNHWTPTPGGGAGAEYDWELPVYADLTLYASWTGVPDSATYKVVWWLEAANFDGIPSPGNPEDYIFAGEETRRGTPGEYARVETMPPYAGDRAPSDPLRYAQYQYCAPTIVSGANNTTVNVYLVRKAYTIVFDLSNNGVVPGRWLRFGGGTVYNNDEYKLSVKYEQDITQTWPCAATAAFGPDGFKFYAWVASIGCGIYGEGTNFVTRRNTVTSELMPVDPNATGFKLTTVAGGAGSYSLRYWFEAYNGQAGLQRLFPDPPVSGVAQKTYILDEQYSQSGMNIVSHKILPGMLPVSVSGGRNYSDSDNGPGFSDSGHPILNLYYDRAVNNLYYDLGGAGAAISPVYGLKSGEPLAPYKPADPEWANHRFVGWYKDANRILAFDFENAVMAPGASITVFAKWEPTDYEVRFWDGGVYLGSQGAGEGQPVDFTHLRFNGVLYDANLLDPLKGAFDGWKYLPQGAPIMSSYPVDLLVYGDLDLYAIWDSGVYTVNERYVDDLDRSAGLLAQTYTLMGGGMGFRYEKKPPDIDGWVATGYSAINAGFGVSAIVTNAGAGEDDWYAPRQDGEPAPSFAVTIDPVDSDLEIVFLYRPDKNGNKIPDDEEQTAPPPDTNKQPPGSGGTGNQGGGSQGGGSQGGGSQNPGNQDEDSQNAGNKGAGNRNTGSQVSGNQGTGSNRTAAQRSNQETIGSEATSLAGFIADHINYIQGYPWGAVAPDDAITRAETAEIIYRLLEASRSSTLRPNPFPDTGGEWYTQSISYLASIGIIKGYPDGTFRPDDPITRAEFATMISGFDILEPAGYNAFEDAEDHWAVGYINSAAVKGWVSGYPEGDFRPENNITRAEVVTVVNRMLNRKIKADDIPDWAPVFYDLDKSHWAYADITEASIGHVYTRKTDDYEIWTIPLG